MSMTFSGVTSPSVSVPVSLKTPLQSDAVQQELSLAVQETLRKAPPSVEEAVGRTDIPAVIPDTSERLERQNEETSLLGAYRRLEQAVGTGEGVKAALGQLEELAAAAPDRVTSEMRGLLEQARNLDMDKAETGVPQEKGLLDSEHTAGIAHNDTGELFTLEDGDLTIDPSGNLTQDVLLSDTLMQELEAIRPGQNMLPDTASLEEMKAVRDQLENLQKRLPSGSAAEQPVSVALGERIFQLDRAISSRERLGTALDALNRVASQPLEERASRLNTSMRDLVLQFRKQAEALNRMTSPNLPEALEAADTLEQNGYISAHDAQTLEEAFCTVLEKSLAAFTEQNGDIPTFKAEALHGLGKLCLNAGIDLMALGRTLTDCLRGAQPLLLPTALAGMQEGADAVRLQFVDMLFQGAYPEHADMALLLKQAVVSPEKRDGVAYQHELVQSLRVLQNDILAAVQPSRGHEHGRSGVIDRAAGSLSARSFLLTPELVKSLTAHKKIDLPDFNYHIAHVALLQAAAESHGLLNVGGVREGAEELRSGQFDQWCESLGLNAETRAYASGLAAELEDPATEAGAAARLVEASERFNKGLKGATNLDKAGKLVARVASMATHRSSGRHIHAMYQSNPEFLAREVLDKHIVNLTGLIDVNDRLLDPEEGLALNDERIDAAMREQVSLLKKNMADGVSGAEVQQTLHQAMRDRAETLHGLRGRRGRLVTSIETMRTFANASGESLRLRALNAERREALKQARAEMDMIKFAWPHQTGERESVCRKVVRLVEVLQQIEKYGDKVSRMVNSSGHTPLEERDELLRHLSDVELRTMRHTGKAQQGIPDATTFIETILPKLLPRAKAVLYFIDGGAKADQKAIRDDMRKLEKNQQIISSVAGKAEKVFGNNIVLRMEMTVVAAMLRVFLETGADSTTFTVQNPATLDSIKMQLKDWGIDPNEGLMAGIVPMVLGNMTSAQGGINMARLRQENRQVHLGFAGKEARNERTRELREQGLGRMAARREADSIVRGDRELGEAYRREGVRGLMAGVSRPGQGFVYDRTRGVVLDLGSVFSPLDSKLITKLDVHSPLTAKLEALHGNSLAVTNMGGDTYQVLLKGRTAVNVAAALNIPLAAGFSAKVGAGGGGEKSGGVALRFVGKEHCRAFLEAFMNSETGTADRTRNRELWLKADQIRFVYGNSVSTNASLAVSHALFARKLSATQSLAVTGMASIALSGNVRQTLESNSHGETAIFERSGSVRGGLALSTGMKNSTDATLSNINPLARGTNIGFDILQRFRVSTGARGLMGDTCMELECGRGEHQLLHRLHTLLPEEVRTRIMDSPELFDKVQRALHKAPPSARLVAHYELKPGLLDELRSRFIEARHADEKGREAILSDIHDRLASRDAYEPTRLSIRLNAPAPISRSWSPGLGSLKIVRSNTMQKMNVINIDLH